MPPLLQSSYLGKVIERSNFFLASALTVDQDHIKCRSEPSSRYNEIMKPDTQTLSCLVWVVVWPWHLSSSHLNIWNVGTDPVIWWGRADADTDTHQALMH